MPASSFIMGFGFSSLSSSLWPYINIQVSQDQIGSVNGAISSVQSVIRGLFQLTIGHVLQRFGYFCLSLVLLASLYLAWTVNAQFIILHGNGFKGLKLAALG